ncbi:hypothetical protein F9L16_20480 [Agarivorans sp. B2Z047]|uniref:Lipoprotein n=1 Tax=Agarivorans albus MKT 106 TaxID=1331007 RepID=R9PQD0_AGAAL|nr:MULTISPECIES: lipoprotein [Agarivorans]MPW31355.1 hypothetical protein [Agarivorans sp. B2Z047]UQN42682.1 lipoprotein [Agarivorans sp. B2Z047]GAD00301.1 hypothetical protein AALB_0381 [Agarivorans albus MKT 106]
MNKQAIAVILLSIGLSGCGQKGPLVHPPAEPESAPEQVTPSE